MNKRFACGSLLLLSATLAGPICAAGLTQMEQLGKIMYQDKDFSYNQTQSCQTCHHHISGFADPTNMRDPVNTVVSLGADGTSKGGRNAPSSAYAGFSPALHVEGNAYVGGMFWDGRKTGWSVDLADPLAEQAQGPPLNPVEMNMPNEEAVVDVVRNATYARLFRKVFGSASLDDTSSAFDNIARAIAAYERSAEVQAFTSRFDSGQLSDQENRGKASFALNCVKCHSMETVAGAKGPLFTNYTYANIGLPPNIEDGVAGTDLGLGGFLLDAGVENAALENGKFKVPTLRNVAFSAPYGHNGYFATLREMVVFKNTRDIGGWPKPDIAENVYHEDGFGDMRLSDQEVDDIVAFLMTLTDR